MKIVRQNIAAVKKYLEQKRKQIELHITTLKQEDPFSDTDRLSDNAATDTEAREEIGHERVEAIKGELMIQLAKVKRALSKIGIGRYGYCDNCGNAIEKARLKAFPMAEYCLKCETEIEKRE